MLASSLRNGIVNAVSLGVSLTNGAAIPTRVDKILMSISTFIKHLVGCEIFHDIDEVRKELHDHLPTFMDRILRFNSNQCSDVLGYSYTLRQARNGLSIGHQGRCWELPPSITLPQLKRIILIEYLASKRAELEQAGKKDAPILMTGFDLSHVELKGIDLRNCDFSGANFQYADFRGSFNLRGANFSGVDLRGANFANLDLTKANFSQAYLHGANFTGTCISEADFTVAWLEYANLTSTVATKTKFIHTRMCGATGNAFEARFAIFKKADLNNVRFSDVDFSHADFSEAIPIRVAVMDGINCPDILAKKKYEALGKLSYENLSLLDPLCIPTLVFQRVWNKVEIEYGKLEGESVEEYNHLLRNAIQKALGNLNIVSETAEDLIEALKGELFTKEVIATNLIEWLKENDDLKNELVKKVFTHKGDTDARDYISMILNKNVDNEIGSLILNWQDALQHIDQLGKPAPVIENYF